MTPSPFHGYGSRRRGTTTTTRMYRYYVNVMMVAVAVTVAVFVLGESFQLPLAAVESFSFHQHLQSSPSLLQQRQWKHQQQQQQQQQRPMMILVQNLNTAAAAVEESENKEYSTSHRGDSSSLQTSSRPTLSTSSLIRKIARKALMATFIVSLVSFGPVVKAAWASSTTSTASLAAATTAAVGATANIPVAATTLAPVAAAASTAIPGAVTAAKTAIAAASCPVSAMTEIRLSLRLLYAAFLGAALGKERSFAKHSAGVRTMALVSMGAAAFTVCSSYGFASFIEVGCRYDPSRMAANVISGVGFVGAGVITTSARNNENIVHGLTTAATIWLSAAVGVACGVGLSRIATTAAITTLSILRLGRKKKRNEDRNPTSHEFTTSSTSSTKPQVLTRTRDNVEEENNLRSYEGVINDHDVNEAEIHLTSEWDENNQEEEEEQQRQQIHPPPPHATYADMLRQKKSNEQKYKKQLQEQSHEEHGSRMDDVSDNDFSDNSSQLLDAARTYQAYNLNATTSFDFDQINAVSKNRKKKKVASSTSARTSSFTENRQDKYYP